MKPFFLILTMLCFTQMWAQNSFVPSGSDRSYDLNNEQMMLKSKAVLTENHIATVKTFKVDKIGAKQLTDEAQFDEKGNWVEHKTFSRKGEEIWHYRAKWNEEGKLSWFERVKKNGRKTYMTSWEYNDNNQVLSYVSTIKGKAHVDGYYTYKDSLLVEVMYGRRGSEERDRWVYSYYDDGKIKQTISYNKKGKETHRWSYACDSEGTQLKKKETEVCKKSELDENGQRKEVYQYNDEKRKIRKMVLTYDAQDNLVEMARYNKKDAIFSRETYSYDERGNRLSYAYYSQKRKNPMSSYVYEYDENNLVVKEVSFKKNQNIRFSKVKEYGVF